MAMKEPKSHQSSIQSLPNSAQTLDHALMTSLRHGHHPIARETLTLHKLKKEGDHLPKHVLDDK